MQRLFADFDKKTNYSNYEIIVVDNASCDKSVEYLHSLDLPITVIENSENVSFSKGNNDAAKIANGEYLILLNNDIEPTYGWLNEMVGTILNNENVGSVGAKLIFPYYEDMKNQGKSFSIQHAGVKFREERTPYIYGPYHEHMYSTMLFSDELNHQKEVISNTAACLLVPKDVYFELDGLDEQYIYGYEDIDFAFKLYNAGYKTLYNPAVLLFHHESATRHEDDDWKNQLNYHNIMHFVDKWGDFIFKEILKDKIEANNFFTNKKLDFTIVGKNNDLIKKAVFKLNIVIKIMADEMMVKELEEVVVRFSGDSGDGMQLAGNIFSNVSATVGNDICTFPDYPADIRAPQGSLTGVSGFQVHIGAGQVYTPGDRCHVLVAMNPSALKTQIKFCKPQGLIITDSDSFEARDLEKAQFKTDNPFEELGVKQEVLEVPISSMCKESLKDSGLDNKSVLRCKNMFALGLVCWLFNRNLAAAEKMLREKFAKKPEIAEANIKVLNDGFNYGANTHASVSTYKIESKAPKSKGLYTDINGNKATSYGLIAAAEKAGLELYLGSYPITPATDILHELAKHKSLGVKTVQCEDEIAGCASAVGAAFAGALAVTTTSGPGVCLKSEAMNLAVIGELPLVIVNVQRGGPSTGLPTKSEQTDLLQALYGRNGESPMPVIAATSPTNCFDAAYMAAKIALEHMTPVVLLTDAFVANGSAAWKLPNLDEYPAINPPYVTPDMAGNWTPYQRNEETGVRYWAIPGTEGFMHRIGGLEKSNETGAISTEPENHNKMVHLRQAKVDKIANYIPELEVLGDKDADLLIVGWGGTYGHLRLAMDYMREHGKKVAFAHFQYINPLPKNTADVLRKYKKIVVAEQNLGQFAGYLRMKVPGLNISQFNQVKGQPFVTRELIDAFTKLLEE